jgi:hypothetical protein
MEGKVIFSLMIVGFVIIFLIAIIVEFIYHLLRGEVKINKKMLTWKGIVSCWPK